jgi:ABC-2 type transport system ATP-binding protein
MDRTADSASPAIRFSGVAKRFGKALVLDYIDLEVRQGTFAGLAGINGAGKMTLIKCLLDFCSLDAGNIEIFGHSHQLPASRQNLAFLPEQFSPPYYLTGREFMRMTRSLRGLPYDEAGVLEVFQQLDLSVEALVKPVRTYSKGMTQKLGLAAALASERDFYLLDEPMTGLDPKARAKVKTLLAHLKSRGKTLLFTSHSLADIEEICDHMLILHAGKITFSGAPSELRARFDESTLERAFLRCIDPDG